MDSQTAWSICMLLRKLVNNNHTILCTVHQPSAQLFNMFDRLLLLQDGATLYFGDIGQDASVLTHYFEIKGARKCLAEENPAEWMLDVTAKRTAPSSDSHNWSSKWQLSQERESVAMKLQSLQTDSSTRRAKKTSQQELGEFAAPLTQQITLLVKRVFQDQWRNPLHLYTKTAVCIGLVSS